MKNKSLKIKTKKLIKKAAGFAVCLAVMFSVFGGITASAASRFPEPNGGTSNGMGTFYWTLAPENNGQQMYDKIESDIHSPKGVKSGWNNLKDTYREGAYGEEAAGAIKFDEEFRKGSTYKALQSNPNFSEESVQAMLDAGITDKKAMTAILDSGIDVNDAVKFHTVAENCPNEIYYDDNMLRTFWKRTMGIEEKNAERIRDILGQFK